MANARLREIFYFGVVKMINCMAADENEAHQEVKTIGDWKKKTQNVTEK